MKKILVIGTTDSQGGAARVGWDLGHELIRRGYDIKFLVGYQKSREGIVNEFKKPLLTKYVDEHSHYNLTSLMRHVRAYITANNIDYGAYDELFEHPWYRAAEIVHCHNMHGNFIKLDAMVKISREKKLVWTLHDMWPVTAKCAYTEDPSKWEDGYHACKTLRAYPPMLWDNTRYLWNKKRLIYQSMHTASIVTPSEWLGAVVGQSMLKKFPRQVIYNGIDTNVFKPRVDVLRTKLGISSKCKIVLFVAQGGLSDPRKGYQYIQAICREYQDDTSVVFVALGDGKAIERHQNVITVPFEADPYKLTEYYASATMLLFPSLAENCPLVVLEAMSAGLPIVAFNAGGIRELVTHKMNGYVAKYSDQHDLTTGVRWVMEMDHEQQTKISHHNYQKVRRLYSIARMTDQYEALYARL